LAEFKSELACILISSCDSYFELSVADGTLFNSMYLDPVAETQRLLFDEMNPVRKHE
jgi:hypothetical protein